MCVTELVGALKSSIDPNVELLLGTCFRRALDSNDEILELAKVAIVAISAFCHEGKVLNFVVNNWNITSFMVKIACGISLEKLVPRIGTRFAIYKDNYIAIIQIIAQMLADGNFEVRRLGKKIYFKLLNTDIDKESLFE